MAPGQPAGRDRGASLTAAVAAAIADIGEDGGTPTHLALNPTDAATEVTREATDGQPVRPDGMEQLQGLQIVRVPGLAEPLVYDATRIYAVVAVTSGSCRPRSTRPPSRPTSLRGRSPGG